MSDGIIITLIICVTIIIISIIGKKKDDRVTIDLKFPDNYTKDLAGKAVKFDVTINEIKIISLMLYISFFYNSFKLYSLS